MQFEWKERFESLKEVGEYFSRIPEYEGYGSYCLYREKGLRKDAMAALNAYIRNCRTHSIAMQRLIASKLCTSHKADPNYLQYDHTLMPKPLTRYFLEVVGKWNDEDNSDPMRWHWLGNLSGDPDFAIRGLDIHPNDEALLLRSIHSHLNYVSYQMHHVQDGGFIGSTYDASASIVLLVEQAMRLPAGAKKRQILGELKFYKTLLAAWIAYSDIRSSMSFPKWCRQFGYEFEFHESYYL
jgi:hypothetical protein